jgi:hypothetical protein
MISVRLGVTQAVVLIRMRTCAFSQCHAVADVAAGMVHGGCDSSRMPAETGGLCCGGEDRSHRMAERQCNGP